MSKKRRDWYDAVMTIAVAFSMVAILMFVGCVARKMNPWLLTGICFGVAVVSFLAALIIHEGRDVLALPQALWMAIQDRRKRNGLHKR